MAAGKMHWYLTLGFDPFADAPTQAQVESAFGSYKSTVGKESTRSSGRADEFKQIAKDMDTHKDAIIAEVLSPSAKREAREAILEAMSESVEVLKLQSSDFDEAMMEQVSSIAKKGIKGAMHPKGKYKITDKAVEEAILAAGCTPVGRIHEESKAAFEDLRIDEQAKNRFANIDKSLGNLDIEDLYELVGLDRKDAGRLPSSQLVAKAREIEKTIPRDADSAGAAKATLLKSAIEVFGDEGLTESYGKYLKAKAIEEHLGMMVDLGSNGKSISAGLAKAQVSKLADDLSSSDEAVKLFFGFLGANNLATDISYGDLESHLRKGSGPDSAEPSSSASQGDSTSHVSADATAPFSSASASASSSSSPFDSAPFDSTSSSSASSPWESQSNPSAAGTTVPIDYAPYDPSAPVGRTNSDASTPGSTKPVTTHVNAQSAIPVPKPGQTSASAASSSQGGSADSPLNNIFNTAKGEEGEKKKSGCFGRGCRVLVGLFILYILFSLVGMLVVQCAAFNDASSPDEPIESEVEVVEPDENDMPPIGSDDEPAANASAGLQSASELSKAPAFLAPAFPALAEQSGPYGYVNAEAQWDLEPQFESASFFENGLAPQKDAITGKYGYIDETGQWAISPKFDEASMFSEGIAWVREDGIAESLYGGSLQYFNGDDYYYIDTAGNRLFDRVYWQISTFSGGFAVASWGDGAQREEFFGVIDKSGKIVATLYDGDQVMRLTSIDAFSDGLARVQYQNKFGFIDTAGNFAIPLSFDKAGNFSEGYAAAFTNSSDMWGYIDKTGNTVIRPQFAEAGEFVDGLAPVCTSDGSYGYINQAGEFAIGPQFDDADEFNGGYAAVKVGDYYGLIDKAGNFVINPIFVELESSPIMTKSGWGSGERFDPNASTTNWDQA